MKLLKFFFNKEAVIDELKAGPLLAVRAKDFLLFTFLFSLVSQLFWSLVPNLFSKEPKIGMEVLISTVIALSVSLIVFVIMKYLLERLYEFNGGAKGINFFERLFVLVLSASLRTLKIIVPVFIVYFGALFLMIKLGPPPASLFVILVVPFLIFVIVWPVYFIYTECKAGFLELCSKKDS